jgi:hypothetical protein
MKESKTAEVTDANLSEIQGGAARDVALITQLTGRLVDINVTRLRTEFGLASRNELLIRRLREAAVGIACW